MVGGYLWGIRTEVVVGQAFALVTVLQPWDCKSIAKASKVRILHLPPRAVRASDDLRKRRSGALFMYPVGVSKWRCMSRSSGPWAAGLRPAQTRKSGRASARSVRNTGGSLGPRHRAGRTRPHADLWGCRGWGYAMVAGFRTIAIGARWCGSGPRAALPAGALTSATNDPRHVSAILDPRATPPARLRVPTAKPSAPQWDSRIEPPRVQCSHR